MKKIISLILCAAMLLLTACTISFDGIGKEKNSDSENIGDITDENGNAVMSPTDSTYESSAFDIDEFLKNNADILPNGIDGNSTGLSGITDMSEMYSMLGIDTTPVAFTPERVAGLDPEWPWAVVEIGWKGYGDESKWVRYSDLFADEEEEYDLPEETQSTTTEAKPEPTTQQDPAFYDEPDRNMPNISDDNKWPAAYLPQGMPVYPEGDFEIDFASPGNVLIEISNSSMEAFANYLDTLKNAGWDVEKHRTPESLIMGFRGMWWFQCGFYDGIVVIQISYDDWNT